MDQAPRSNGDWNLPPPRTTSSASTSSVVVSRTAATGHTSLVFLSPFSFQDTLNTKQKQTRLFLSLLGIIFLSDPKAYQRYEPALVTNIETGKHKLNVPKVPNIDCLQTCALVFVVNDENGNPQGDFYSHPFLISETGELPESAAAIADKSAPGKSLRYCCYGCCYKLKSPARKHSNN